MIEVSDADGRGKIASLLVSTWLFCCGGECSHECSRLASARVWYPFLTFRKQGFGTMGDGCSSQRMRRVSFVMLRPGMKAHCAIARCVHCRSVGSG